jgi:hypothetical protein
MVEQMSAAGVAALLVRLCWWLRGARAARGQCGHAQGGESAGSTRVPRWRCGLDGYKLVPWDPRPV